MKSTIYQLDKYKVSISGDTVARGMNLSHALLFVETLLLKDDNVKIAIERDKGIAPDTAKVLEKMFAVKHTETSDRVIQDPEDSTRFIKEGDIK